MLNITFQKANDVYDDGEPESALPFAGWTRTEVWGLVA